MSDSSSLRRLQTYIRKNGLNTVPERLRQEVRVPTTPVGKRMHPVWRMGRHVLSWVRGKNVAFGGDTLVAFYDLQVSPVTYDFAWFLVAADLERRRRQMARLHVVVVSGETWASGPESAEYLSVVNAGARRQRLFDILIPLTELMPSVGGVTAIEDRAVADRFWDSAHGRVFPADYSPALPYLSVPFPMMVTGAAQNGEDVPSLCVPEAACRWVETWRSQFCGGRPLVTITIRDFDYQPKRNSNIADWVAFGGELRSEGFAVAVVPDMGRSLDSRAMGQFGDLPVLIEPAWHLIFRAALYEAAAVNLGVNTGPMALNWLNRRCKYISFKMVLDDEQGSSIEFQRSLGLDPSEPFPFAKPHQVLCMDADELPVLRREFSVLWGRLEVEQALGSSLDRT